MSKLAWNKTGEKTYETGISNGVLYPRSADGTYPLGVAWNGLTALTESPSGAEATPFYADNIKWLSLLSAEEFAATLEAFMYPDEFEACNGTAEIAEGVSVGQQDRQVFGLAYKTIIGNDTKLNENGYKIHIIYGAQASPSEMAYTTVNDTPELTPMSWEISTTPIEVPGLKPTATLVINSTKVEAAKLAELEKQLFGADAVEGETPVPAIVPHLLTPQEIADIIAEG